MFVRTVQPVKRSLAVLLIPLALVACSSSKKAGTSSGGATTTTSKSTTTAKPSGYKIGDTASTGGFQVTVYGVKDPADTGNQFDKPKVGNHFVTVDVQVANSGKDQQSFSSLLGFHLLDGQNRQYDEAITTIKPGPPEGQIAGGQAIRGNVSFEVPDGTTGLKLRVQGGPTAAGAVFNLA